MKNRKQPFGYKMEQGEIVPQPREAEAVQSIYLQYLAGASFKQLAEQLQTEDVPYDEDRPWNKNMVARILEDDRYTGGKQFPELVAAERFYAAQERRKAMRPEYRQTSAQKELRKLCGEVPPCSVERMILNLLNRLIREPQLLCLPGSSERGDPILERQRHELDEFLHHPPVDEDRVRDMALHCAAAALENIGPEEYETERLRRQFRSHSQMEELDAELLRQSVRKINYDSKAVKVLLKNSQVLEERDPA